MNSRLKFYLISFLLLILFYFIILCNTESNSLRITELNKNIPISTTVTLSENEKNTKRIIIFFSSSCPVCKIIHEKHLSKIIEALSDQVNIYLKLLIVTKEDHFLKYILDKEQDKQKQLNIIHIFFSRNTAAKEKLIVEYDIKLIEKDRQRCLKKTYDTMMSLEAKGLPCFIINDSVYHFYTLNNKTFFNEIQKAVLKYDK